MAQTPEEKEAAAAAKQAEKEAAAAATGVSEAEADATSAAVHTKDGAHIRTYTREDHGDAFHDNAKEFSAHTPESTVTLS